MEKIIFDCKKGFSQRIKLSEKEIKALEDMRQESSQEEPREPTIAERLQALEDVLGGKTIIAESDVSDKLGEMKDDGLSEVKK